MELLRLETSQFQKMYLFYFREREGECEWGQGQREGETDKGEKNPK